jgi:hypothetical protein
VAIFVFHPLLLTFLYVALLVDVAGSFGFLFILSFLLQIVFIASVNGSGFLAFFAHVRRIAMVLPSF